MTKKDYLLGVVAGLLIGLLAMPALSAGLTVSLYNSIRIFIIPFFLLGTPLGLYVAALLGKKIPAVWQIGKFGVIGILNTLVDLGVLAAIASFVNSRYGVESDYIIGMIGTWTVTIYTMYKAISFVVANINSYLWNKYWTFAVGVAQKTKAEYLQFFIISIVGFVINVEELKIFSLCLLCDTDGKRPILVP